MSYNDLRKGRISAIGQDYFITCVVGDRKPVFVDFNLCRSLVKEMMHLEAGGMLTWLAWVIMPDHLHGLVTLENGSLSQSIKLLKGRTARKINAILGTGSPLWQPGFYDRALRKEEDRVALARYIVANPLRAGLVGNIGDYPHWDSVWL